MFLTLKFISQLIVKFQINRIIGKKNEKIRSENYVVLDLENF
jgi:hypothetical protein